MSKSVAWVYTYGSMEVRVNLGGSNWYYLHCKPYHYFVLATLENNGEMSFEDLKKSLSCTNDDHLRSILTSFVSQDLKLNLLLELQESSASSYNFRREVQA